MIAFLIGKVTEQLDDMIGLDVGGVGYGLWVPQEDWAYLAIGSEVKLYVYEHIREQNYDLFGFTSISTKKLFEQLLSVNGVGPKMALAVLSVGTIDEVRLSIAEGNVKFLQAASGVGKKVAERIGLRAARILSKNAPAVLPEDIRLANRLAIAPDGRSITLREVAYNALHHEDQEQIMAVASYKSPVSPPPFAAQFAEVSVDTTTGQVTVDRLVMAVDSGVIVNPITASGQIEGGMTQALGYAVCEEMTYDQAGRALQRDLRDYHIFQAHEMPALDTIFVETFEPSHPFGVKAAAEIPMDGVAPAVGNAVLDACGAEIDDNPITPEKVWLALKG